MDAYTCTLCGAWVTDGATHSRWHQAQASIWAWVERVAGASCEDARELLGRGDE